MTAGGWVGWGRVGCWGGGRQWSGARVVRGGIEEVRGHEDSGWPQAGVQWEWEVASGCRPPHALVRQWVRARRRSCHRRLAGWPAVDGHVGGRGLASMGRLKSGRERGGRGIEA